MRETLWIIDITNLAFRALLAAPPLCNSKGCPTGGVYLFTRMLLSFLHERKPTHVAAVWDAPTRSFRKDLSPDYKANRTPLPAHLKQQLTLCRAVVRALPLPVLQVDGVEADDTMATLVLQARRDGMDPVLMTSDKDLTQLIGDDTYGHGARFYDPQKQVWVDAAGVVAKWGVGPMLVGDLLALTGDASDNVHGVPGIGPKTAAGLLVRYGTLDGVIAHAGEVGGKRGEALRTAIADGSLALARRLVELRTDVPLPLAPADLVLPPSDDEMRRFLFTELEFHSLLPSEMPTLEEARAGAPVYDSQGKRA